MPKYKYKCNKCDGVFVVHHEMSEIKKNCELCVPVEDSLVKLPTSFSLFGEEDKTKTKKVGSVVKKSIENFREELEREKEDLRNKIWDSND